MDEARRQLDAVAKGLGDRPRVRRHLVNLARGLPYDQEVRIGQELQEGLLPTRLPQVRGLGIAADLMPALGATGDFYDVFEVTEGTVGVFVAEARHPGLSCVPLLTLAKVALDSARTEFHNAQVIMAQINEELVHRWRNGRAMTAFLGLLDTRTLHFRYVNASHRSPVLYGLGAPRALTGKGGPLGIDASAEFEEVELQLEPGERVFFYTSGLTQARDAAGKVYGAARLKKLLRVRTEQAPDAVIDRVRKDLRAHRGKRHFETDVTMVALALSPDIMLENQITIRSEPDQLSRPVTAIMDRLKEMKYDERTQFAVRLCLEEALINALKHGNKMDRMKRIMITYHVDERELRISVQDEGHGFHPKAVPDPRLPENLEVAHGRGLLLMRSYMDDVLYSDNGRKVTLIKKAPWE